tara:strand:- start:121 stop:342 length:222 start_codon:yes stop_codon:yes gene_type:complete
VVPQGCRSDQRPIGPEPGWNDPRASRELQSALPVETFLGRLEEWNAKAQGHRTSHHDQWDIKQVHHRGHRLSN